MWMWPLKKVTTVRCFHVELLIQRTRNVMGNINPIHFKLIKHINSFSSQSIWNWRKTDYLMKKSIDFMVSFLFLIFHFLHWRDSSVIKNTCCSFGGPGLDSQHSPGGSQLSTTLGSVFWPLWPPCTNVVHRDTPTGKKLMHIKWNEWIFKRFKSVASICVYLEFVAVPSCFRPLTKIFSQLVVFCTNVNFTGNTFFWT